MVPSVGNRDQPASADWRKSKKAAQTNQLSGSHNRKKKRERGRVFEKRRDLWDWLCMPKNRTFKTHQRCVEYNYCSCSKQIIKMIRSLGALIWRVSIIRAFFSRSFSVFSSLHVWIIFFVVVTVIVVEPIIEGIFALLGHRNMVTMDLS